MRTYNPDRRNLSAMGQRPDERRTAPQIAWRLERLACTRPVARLGVAALLLGGCSAVLAVMPDQTPYSEAPPQPAAADSAMQSAALAAARSDSWSNKVDFRRAVIGRDWAVVRDSHGAIHGRRRLIWVGGPARQQDHAGDCFYLLFTATERYMGGGSYGATRYAWASETSPNKHKLRCADDPQG